MLYYNGLAIADDKHYDDLEETLAQLDPDSWILRTPGWDPKWLQNRGYLHKEDFVKKGKTKK